MRHCWRWWDDVLAAVLILAIDLAPDEVALAHWWGEHATVLRRLSEDDWAAVWAAKERRKAEWAGEEARARERKREPQATFWKE